MTAPQRPRTRGACLDAERPCPHVTSCRFHLLYEAAAAGKRVDLEHARETCALDVADRGGISLKEIGALLGVSRARAEQIEVLALAKLRDVGGLADWQPPDPPVGLPTSASGAERAAARRAARRLLDAEADLTFAEIAAEVGTSASTVAHEAADLRRGQGGSIPGAGRP